MKKIIIATSVLFSFGLITSCAPSDEPAAPQTVQPEKAAPTQQAEAKDEPKIVPPAPEDRQITVMVNDQRKTENPILKFRAETMALGAVLKKVGALDTQQDLIVRCEGGYNKQPPLYSLDLDIVHGGEKTNSLAGLDDTSTIHDVCMKGAEAHLEMLRQTAPDELKYFR
jgi:hypothetical protein